MDGVHDLGGREGFGPILDKRDDKAFHAEWEMRAFENGTSLRLGEPWSIDWFRHARELTDPVDYLTRPYFDQWLTTLAAQLIDEGYLTLDEVKPAPLLLRQSPAVPPRARRQRALMSQPPGLSRSRQYGAALRAGRRPCVAGSTARPGHTRLPQYARGRAGVIHAHHGGHVFADAAARGEHRGEHLYTVSFASAELWPERRGAAIACSSICGRAILVRPELGFLKAKDGEPVFGEPWHAETLALADILIKSGAISSTHWAETLEEEIKAWTANPTTLKPTPRGARRA